MSSYIPWTHGDRTTPVVNTLIGTRMANDTRQRHTLPPTLAARLRRARIQQGLGLREAASQVGISASHLCLIEQGKRCPSLSVAQDLVDRLRPADDLRIALLSVARPDTGRVPYGSGQPAQAP